jgi:arylsulfatase A-like enzyme
VEAISLNVDIAPTILDLAGLRAPDDMHGSSLVPAWNGDRLGARSGFYYEHFVHHPRITPTEGVRTHSMKYLLYPNEVADNEMLFDLGVDPYEEQNLAQDPAHAEELDRLRRLMTEYRDALT